MRIEEDVLVRLEELPPLQAVVVDRGQSRDRFEIVADTDPPLGRKCLDLADEIVERPDLRLGGEKIAVELVAFGARGCDGLVDPGELLGLRLELLLGARLYGLEVAAVSANRSLAQRRDLVFAVVVARRDVGVTTVAGLWLRTLGL